MLDKRAGGTPAIPGRSRGAERGVKLRQLTLTGTRNIAQAVYYMKRLARLFWVLLALLFLFEAWLWDRLAPIVGHIVAAIPWGWIKPALVRLVDRLSPPATLVVFVVPFILLLPLKFLEFWFLAHRQWVATIAVLLLAKLVGLGVTAFIFEATKDKLLQMAWFLRLYEFFLWARHWAHEKIMPRLREWSRQTVDPVAQRLRRWRPVLQPRHAGRLLQRLTRIRRRMRAAS
jgi:hypothetical protein